VRKTTSGLLESVTSAPPVECPMRPNPQSRRPPRGASNVCQCRWLSGGSRQLRHVKRDAGAALPRPPSARAVRCCGSPGSECPTERPTNGQTSTLRSESSWWRVAHRTETRVSLAHVYVRLVVGARPSVWRPGRWNAWRRCVRPPGNASIRLDVLPVALPFVHSGVMERLVRPIRSRVEGIV